MATADTEGHRNFDHNIEIPGVLDSEKPERQSVLQL